MLTASKTKFLSLSGYLRLELALDPDAEEQERTVPSVGRAKDDTGGRVLLLTEILRPAEHHSDDENARSFAVPSTQAITPPENRSSRTITRPEDASLTLPSWSAGPAAQPLS